MVCGSDSVAAERLDEMTSLSPRLRGAMRTTAGLVYPLPPSITWIDVTRPWSSMTAVALAPDPVGSTILTSGGRLYPLPLAAMAIDSISLHVPHRVTVPAVAGMTACTSSITMPSAAMLPTLSSVTS